MISGLITAFRTLTVIPVPGPEAQRKYLSLPWFMLVGTFLGVIQAAAAWGIRLHVPALAGGTGLILVVVNHVLTGALHLDGLADTADAFGTVHSKEKILDILKDPNMGTFGISAIVIAILCRMLLYQRLSGSAEGLTAIIAALALARILQGLLLCRFPYGRGSEGKAFGFKGGAVIQLVLVFQAACVLAVLIRQSGMNMRFGTAFLAGLAAMTPVVYAYLRRTGGITGDCIGACTELFEIGFLTWIAAGG